MPSKSRKKGMHEWNQLFSQREQIIINWWRTAAIKYQALPLSFSNSHASTINISNRAVFPSRAQLIFGKFATTVCAPPNVSPFTTFAINSEFVRTKTFSFVLKMRCFCVFRHSHSPVVSLFCQHLPELTFFHQSDS